MYHFFMFPKEIVLQFVCLETKIQPRKPEKDLYGPPQRECQCPYVLGKPGVGCSFVFRGRGWATGQLSEADVGRDVAFLHHSERVGGFADLFDCYGDLGTSGCHFKLCCESWRHFFLTSLPPCSAKRLNAYFIDFFIYVIFIPQGKAFQPAVPGTIGSL